MAWALSYDTAIGLALSFLVVTFALQNFIDRRSTVTIGLVATIWYWTSALWAAVTKEILNDLQQVVVYPSTSVWLTFLPQALSYVLVQALAILFGLDLCTGTCFREMRRNLGMWQMAGAAYFFGQLFTVAALALDAPSLVFVVKAIEPLSTALLAIPVLHQTFNVRLFLAILVACVGIMITAAASHGGFNGVHYSSAYMSMTLGMLANIGFSARACVAKRALVFDSNEPLEAYGMCTVFATQSGVVLLLVWLILGRCILNNAGDMTSILQHLSQRPGAWLTASLTYFLYQGSSILLLSCFKVETHALLVALKHVFVVVLASLITGAVLNPPMILGLLLVSLGVCWYLSSPEDEDSEKEPILPTKADGLEQSVSYPLIAVVISVVGLGTFLPLWHL